MKKLIAMLGAVVAAVTSAWAEIPEPFAQWSTIVDNATGGAEGTPGAGLTLTAGSATIADGVATFTKASSDRSDDGMRITWEQSAYTATQMTVLIEYSDYDDSGISNNCIMSAEWADNVGEVLAGGRGNNDAGKLAVAYGVSSNAGGTIASASSVVPKAGILMLSMSGSGTVTGTRLAMAPKYHDGSTLKFVEVYQNGGIKYTGCKFKSLRFGGALPDTSKYHRPGLKIKSIKIYDTFLTAADMNAEFYPTPELQSNDPYAVFAQNFENRIVSVSSSGDVIMGNSAAQAKVKIFDLATKENTDLEFLGAGTNYTSFPGNLMSRNGGHGWTMFCDTQSGYGNPGVVLRFPTYDSENPTSLSIKGCFQPMCLGGLMVEEGAANGTTNPKLAWDNSNRKTKLGDQRTTGGVPTFFVLKDDLTLDRGAETTIYGDITFDIASDKKFNFGSGAITLNDGAVLHLKGAGTIKYDARSNNSAAINASGKTLDFTGKTSANTAAYFVGPLTVDADTVIKLPASVTSGEGFALCTGALSAPEGSVRKTITVGESDKDAIVTYDAGAKTITYQVVVATLGENGYTSLADALAALGEGQDPTDITLVDTTITTLPEGYEGYKIVNGVIVAKTYVAQIGDNKYETYADAKAACTGTETIVIISDVDLAKFAKASENTTVAAIEIAKGATVTGYFPDGGSTLPLTINGTLKIRDGFTTKEGYVVDSTIPALSGEGEIIDVITTSATPTVFVADHSGWTGTFTPTNNKLGLHFSVAKSDSAYYYTAAEAIAAVDEGVGVTNISLTDDDLGEGYVIVDGMIVANGGTEYPSYVDAAHQEAYTKWAKANGVTDGTGLAEAFALNCAPDAIDAAKDAFKVNITIDADGTVHVTYPAGYNIEPVIYGATTVNGEYTVGTEGKNFFKAVIVLPSAN